MGSCSSMKVHQYARGFNWDHHDQLPSLTLSCKRLRPLAPKLHNIIDTATTPTTSTSSIVSSFDLKSFIRPESGLRKPGSSNEIKILQDSPQSQVETLPGGTRWNPTQEQIGILEMLYRGGMRTPNAQQIEQITAQLGKYGKIEGKNVFYWFQNHKARERQKQKRNSLGLKHSPRTPVVSSTTSAASITTTVNTFLPLGGEDQVEIREEDSPYYKRKCRSWAFECLVGDNGTVHSNACTKEDGDRTLQLFPLHPEGR